MTSKIGPIRTGCNVCQKETIFTAPVSATLLFAPGLTEPYVMLPPGSYRVCKGTEAEPCQGIFNFVSLLQDAHDVISKVGRWTRAVVLFQDGSVADVANETTASNNFVPTAQA
jgi:hypothetical protein